MSWQLLAQLGAQGAQVGAQNYLNKKAFERERAFYWKRFDATNQFNHPVQQMARLKQAGLNPALMYAKSGGTGQANMGPAPDQKVTQMPNLVGGLEYSQLQVQKAQIDLAKDQATNTRLQSLTEMEKANESKSRTDLNKSQKIKLDLENEYISDMQLANLKKMEAETTLIGQQTEESGSRIELNKAQKDKLYTDIVNSTKITEAQLKQYDANVQKLYKETEKIGYDINLTKALTSKTEAEKALIELKKLSEKKAIRGFGNSTGIDGVITQLAWVLGQIINPGI